MNAKISQASGLSQPTNPSTSTPSSSAKDLALRVSQWLLSCPNVIAARPVLVHCLKDSFTGALYTTRNLYQATERAVTEGMAKAGDERLEYRLWLHGRTPRAWDRQKYIWTWNHGHPLDAAYSPSGEWYVAGYYVKTLACDRWPHLTDEYLAEIHPFGEYFLLCEHHTHTYGHYKDQPLDYYETKRTRKPMTVEYLTPA
jgi:hypothetical protein